MYKKRFTADYPFGWNGVLSTLIDDAKEGISNALFSPSVNISEDEKSYHISMIAPGLKKEDFKLSAENNILEISSKGRNDLDKSFLRKEWSIGEFSRRFTIKNDADQKSITAKYEDGILYVDVPKKIEETPKNEIKVQ